jgi:hypothetical protein
MGDASSSSSSKGIVCRSGPVASVILRRPAACEGTDPSSGASLALA